MNDSFAEQNIINGLQVWPFLCVWTDVNTAPLMFSRMVKMKPCYSNRETETN